MDAFLADFVGCLTCQSEGPASSAPPGTRPAPVSSFHSASPTTPAPQAFHNPAPAAKKVDYEVRRVLEQKEMAKLQKQLAHAQSQQEHLHAKYAGLSSERERERDKMHLLVITQDDLVADLSRQVEKHSEQCMKTIAEQRAQDAREEQEQQAQAAGRRNVARFTGRRRSSEAAGKESGRRSSSDVPAADALSMHSGMAEQSAGASSNGRQETTQVWPPRAGTAGSQAIEGRRSSVGSGAPFLSGRRRSSAGKGPEAQATRKARQAEELARLTSR